jgi:adenine deaminase
MMNISGKIVDPHSKKIYKGCVNIQNGKIHSIRKTDEANDIYIFPGMIDSHVHIESSMLTPRGFGQLAMSHGTIAVVTDPHEIANVLGEKGIRYMIEDAKKSPLKIYFGAPSCVPATPFENAGAQLDSHAVAQLLKEDDVVCLAEMMNFPGVINSDPEVMAKISASVELGKPIDGHAPGVSANELKTYIDAGISTDHEAVSISEAEEKIKKGMIIQIREGSAAKDFENLIPLIEKYPGRIMFCTDDSHPDTLAEQHILDLVRRGVKLGFNLFDLLQAATLTPKEHYNLPIGTLQVGDPADFIVLKDLKDFQILDVYIDGNAVTKDDVNEASIQKSSLNYFNAQAINEDMLKVKNTGDTIRVIKAQDRELYTQQMIHKTNNANNFVESDISNDILKLIVLNRYRKAVPRLAFINGFGLKKGAIASSIAHDSHNIIAVGASDIDIVKAVNLLIENKGGLVASTDEESIILKLEIAGLMTHKKPEKLIREYNLLKKKVKQMGCIQKSPFMTLSFMALPVIPELKLTDTGLFDVNTMSFTELFV